MNFIKLDDLNELPLAEIKQKLDKKYGKMAIEDEINKIEEEIDFYETETKLANNVVAKPEEFGKLSWRNTNFLRPRYVLTGHTINFFFRFVPRKTTTFEEIGLTQISQIGYILNIDGACNWEEIFEHWKRGMNSILNLNTTWAAENFLNYIEHSFPGTVVD